MNQEHLSLACKTSTKDGASPDEFCTFFMDEILRFEQPRQILNVINLWYLNFMDGMGPLNK